MSDRRDAERFAEALDRMLEGLPAEGADGDLNPLLEVARQLQRGAVKGEPDPAFLARLRDELVGDEAAASVDGSLARARAGEPHALPGVAGSAAHQEPNCGAVEESAGREVPDRRTMRPRRVAWWRWGLKAACAVLVLAATALLLNSWSGRDTALEPDLARLPSLLDVASAYAEQLGGEARGVIDNATFKLGAKLPEPPGRVRVYRQLREPIDEAGARGLAGRLGISNINVAEEPRAGLFVVTGDGGRLVVSSDFKGYFFFEAGEARTRGEGSPRPPVSPVNVPFGTFVPGFPVAAPRGAAVTPKPGQDEAIRVAEEYLRARGLLGFEHIAETVDDAPPGATPLYRQVAFTPIIESRPVRGLGVVVTVGPGEKIAAVQSTYAALVPADLYPVTSAEDAYKRLQDGQPDLLQVRKQDERGSSASGFSSMAARAAPASGTNQEEELPRYRVGEAVELEGLLSAIVYKSRDGRLRYEATLLAGPREARARAQFKLAGAEIEELSKLDQQQVRIKGRVEALYTRPSGGRIRVEGFEKLYPDERLVTLLGRLEIAGEGEVVLVADDGKRYQLERPAGTPPPVRYSGQRAIVEGRTTERTSKEGYPVLELVSVQSGTDIDRMADLSRYQSQRPRVVPEREPMVTGEVEVKRAELEYYASPAVRLSGLIVANPEPFLLVQPVYTFSGSFEEGRGDFEAQIQAVRPEYVTK